MNNLNNIKKYLMVQIESTTDIMSNCRLKGEYETSYHFECERRAYLNILDFVCDQIKHEEKGGE